MAQPRRNIVASHHHHSPYHNIDCGSARNMCRYDSAVLSLSQSHSHKSRIAQVRNVQACGCIINDGGVGDAVVQTSYARAQHNNRRMRSLKSIKTHRVNERTGRKSGVRCSQRFSFRFCASIRSTVVAPGASVTAIYI